MSVALRMLAVLLAAVAWPALGVHVSPDGKGQALIYPYFTTLASNGNSFNTYVSLVNHDSFGKALRVRFREGRNGREVAGFNLYLRPYDMWTGAVTPQVGGAAIVTRDASCTSPVLPVDVAPGSLQTLPFSAAAYAGTNADGYGDDLDRLREGYAEVLEMAAIGEEWPDPALRCDDYRNDRLTAAFGIPRGHLSGTLTLINVQDGSDFTVNATALEGVATAAYYRPAADPYPDYTAAEISRTAGFFLGNRFYRTVWLTSLEAVNAALLTTYLENEYVTDAVTESATDSIVTLPTKRLAGTLPPFDFPANGSRDVEFYLQYFSREGEPWALIPRCENLCSPLALADLRLQSAASVLSLRPAPVPSGRAGISDVLGSRNGWLVDMPDAAESGHLGVAFMHGSMETDFRTLHSRIDLETGIATDVRPTYHGLPAVGFMVRTFRNGNLACTGAPACQGNYGGAFDHRRRRSATQ